MNKSGAMATLAEIVGLLSAHRVEFAEVMPGVVDELARAEGAAIERWRESHHYVLFGGMGSLAGVVVRKTRHYRVQNEVR